jgi:hypothetical protein
MARLGWKDVEYLLTEVAVLRNEQREIRRELLEARAQAERILALLLPPAMSPPAPRGPGSLHVLKGNRP